MSVITAQSPDDVLLLRRAGLTPTQITSVLGASGRWVRRCIDAAGIARRPGRLHRTGTPLTWPSLWSRFRLEGECWVFTGKPNAAGYGRISVDGQSLLLHRFVYELLVGPIPEGLFLDHLCFNRPCANPAHLDPVPPKINTQRSWAAGRGRIPT